MRLRELYLVETTEEDRAIISLSSSLYDYLQKYKDNNNEHIKVGKIGSLVDTPLEALNPISLELMSGLELEKAVSDDDDESLPAGPPGGAWFKNSKRIILNKDRLTSNATRSALAHELRHALDDFKSDNKANTSGTRYTTPKNKSFRNATNDPYIGNMRYLAEPAEINARFLQVMNALVPIIKAAIDKLPANKADTYIMKKFKENMGKYKISDMFPEGTESKDYRRLIKRAMDFIEKETAHIKSASF